MGEFSVVGGRCGNGSLAGNAFMSPNQPALVLDACSLDLAQANGGPAPTIVPPTTTPIDGGASLLLADGIGYALRRLKQRRQPKPT